jgi:hypothetical protein
VQVIARLASVVHWFNPLVWVADARLRVEQERACDDLVLATGMRGSDYAGHLYEIAQASRAGAFPAWVTLAMARSSQLEARMRAILDHTRNRWRPSARFALVTIVTASFGAALLGAFQLSASAAVPTASGRSAARPPEASPGQPPIAAHFLTPATPVALVEATAPAPLSDALPALQADEQRALLDRYCVACHNSTRRTANVAVDILRLDDVGAAADAWEKVVRKMRSGTHPPSGMARPDAASANAFTSTLEAALDRADQANWAPGVAERLMQNELAARLATFLWSGDPDAELIDLAVRGRLSDPAVLDQQARRMLADPRSDAWLRGFFGQWLHLRNIDEVKPDPTLFPDFDDSLREAFCRETELFVESQVRDDRTVTDLLTANYTFVNERLARHYGIPNISGPEFRRVTIRDDVRTGLLGQASILTVTSYANRTSPVLRGKFVLDMFLGTPPPPPPANVPALKDNDPQNPLPMRRRMEDSVKAPVCASCHSLIDPIGFALENFDATGKWRDTDGGVPIDASGALSDDSTFVGPIGFKIALLQRRDALVRTITERLLAYALAGEIKPGAIRHFHMPAVRAVVTAADGDNYRWASLIAGIVRSTPFQMRRVGG